MIGELQQHRTPAGMPSDEALAETWRTSGLKEVFF